MTKLKIIIGIMVLSLQAALADSGRDQFLIAQRFNRTRQKLEARVRLKNPMAPLIMQNIEKISALAAGGKIEEAQGAIKELLGGLNCKALPAYYFAGDKIKLDISAILKGDICPGIVKEVPYIGMIFGKLTETENLIKKGVFSSAAQNLDKLDKMIETGPVVFSKDERDGLCAKFKDFYQEAAQKYFTHNLEKPLRAIEKIYADLGMGILSYAEILSTVTKAMEDVRGAKVLSKSERKKAVSLAGKGKILPPKRGAVFGMWSLDGFSLLPKGSVIDRFKIQTGQKVKLDNIPLEIQFPDGTLHSLDEPTMVPVPGESNSLKIGPPIEILLLRTWASGAIPAIEFHLHEQNSVGWHIEAFGRSIPEDKIILAQDIIDGEIDDYLKTQAKIIKELDMPLMFRVINEFNAYAVLWPNFGKDGRASIFDLCNGKGGRDKFFAAASIGDLPAVLNMKLDCEAVYNNYADKAIPDAPERIRGAFRHIHDIFDEIGAANITWTAQAAPEYGSPSPLFEKVRAWDKLENYWPGRNYLDWGGISGYNQILEKDKNKAGTIFWAAGWWKEELQKSEWAELPNILYEFSQIPGVQKNNFPEWLKRLMVEYLPHDFPGIRAIQWIGQNMPLETDEEVAAFKEHVTGNAYWQGDFRFSDDFMPPAIIADLKARQSQDKIIFSWTSPGDDADKGRASYYIIKYRRARFKNNIDFMKEPFRLWSDYETQDIEGEPPPAAANTRQAMEVAGLSPGVYYFGIQSVDNAGYNSGISNIFGVELKSTIPP